VVSLARLFGKPAVRQRIEQHGLRYRLRHVRRPRQQDPEPNIRQLNGDRRQVRLIDTTQDAGWIFNGVALYDVGRPVHPDGMPTRARREGTGTDACPKRDFHQMMGDPMATLTEQPGLLVNRLLARSRTTKTASESLGK